MASHSRETLFCEVNSDRATTIATKLLQQRYDGQFCDVVIKVSENLVYAHASVLASISPYFEQLLSSNLPREYSQSSPQVGSNFHSLKFLNIAF